MSRYAVALLVLIAVSFGTNATFAADNVARVTRPPPPVTAVLTPVPADEIPAAAIEVAPAGPVIGPPDIAFGCKRVWRCDAQVCEWRRGCNGIYGYVEAPYYAKPLAEQQWVRDGLPGPDSGPRVTSRKRVVIDPAK